MPLITAIESEAKQAVTLRLPEQVVNDLCAYCKIFGIMRNSKPDISHFVTEAITKNVFNKEKDPRWIEYKQQTNLS